MGSYREITHPNGSGKQSSTLIRSSAHEKIPTVPLYAFYNPESVCHLSSGAIRGVELADARYVSHVVQALVKAKPKRLPFKRIGYLRYLFFPVSTTFCEQPEPADSGGGAIITPRASLAAVEREISIRKPPPPPPPIGTLLTMHRSEEPRSIPPPEPDGTEPDGTPKVSRDLRVELPAVIRRAIERRGERVIRRELRRPKVVLFSGE